MPTLYEHFDFKLLDDTEFGEDSVREELVVPLLKALGYSASPPHRIIRSRKLDHPFVQFGTVRKGISIIPDYLLERDRKYAWILDAKGPVENIDTGKNVEQAYSYAMHRDIRVPIYALCNGRKLTVFHVQRAEPLFDVPLESIDSVWPEILALLRSRAAWPQGIRPDFASDLGLALAKAGFEITESGHQVMQMFLSIAIMSIGRVEDGLYTIASPCGSVSLLESDESAKYMMSFDFDEEIYQELLSKLEPEIGDLVRISLSRQPYKVVFTSPETSPSIGIAAHLGDKTYTNENESYRPFVVNKFF